MEEKVLKILENICGDEVVSEEPDINLVEEHLMESFDYITLLMDLQDQLGVIISPTEYTREEMDTPNKIIAIVKQKLEEA
ncbi:MULTISPECIES: D-alanine--poly(phosphoribitol) ligase subunit 2 [Hornefia]|jgi:D-alanine--poly(phosphoribitol) ligase subunit 2|uniref:D-alanyl carrier protein n=2 Tax=Hornefia TaxID=2815774 RepID=A0A1Q9JJ39_9FIRM|nr:MULTISPECIES: D-alanine--poly(phosphoribitol) ligase subunit 2 [Hornefia]MCI7327516.1 D-alanine--poly(phosphoribitol) ligase subunit 2 [Clostridiales bacterium]MCI7412523.1 D-alanine--poly(phosphoribitol) ligase subunit 2 [Clostridiales bacterium]MCI7680289.1 D-alanine--poly(phosphoribitol) ligase subunit 2 [Clostridiales bacterium]MDD6299458.1 D-alanine--poly(phosphoribitol) ligase subunit 2 [Hornefia butyriciproducens]MDD7020481.1 D-alanine--poly(phosphoribitol) ligase subunit 2 [Hornefia